MSFSFKFSPHRADKVLRHIESAVRDAVITAVDHEQVSIDRLSIMRYGAGQIEVSIELSEMERE